MISILMVVPNLTTGGMEQQLITLLQNIHTSDFKIELLLFRDLPCTLRNELPAHVQVTDLRKKGKIDLAFLLRLFNHIRSTRADLIDSKISGVNEMLMLICGLLRRDALLLEIQSTRARLEPYYRAMKIGLSWFNRKWTVLCNSHRAVQELTGYLPSRIPIAYVGSGIDIQKFQRIDTPRPDNLFHIGFVGRVMPVKNLEVLLRAAHLIQVREKQSIRIHIVGRRGNRAYADKLGSLVGELGLGAIVQFHDYVENLLEAYNQFDVFVHPSLYEGTPTVLLEAMASERVCLVSKGANTDQFVGEDLQFQTQDHAELAEKLMKIKDLSAEARQALGRQNRDLISQNYAIPAWIARHESEWRRAAVQI